MTLQDVLVGVLSAHVAAIVALAIALSRLRERVTRLEEWIRLRERANGRRERR